MTTIASHELDNTRPQAILELAIPQQSDDTIIQDQSSFEEMIPLDAQGVELNTQSLQRARRVGRGILKYAKAVKYGIELGVAGVELFPSNEIIRGALIGGALIAAKGDPAAAMLWTGASTAAIEGAGAVASADLLATDASTRFMRWTNTKLEKVGVKEDAKLPWHLKFVADTLGGAVVAETIRKREDPSRGFAANLKTGLINTAWVSAAAAGAAGGAVTAAEAHPFTTGSIAAAAVTAIETHRRNKAAAERDRRSSLHDYDKKHNITFSVPDNPAQLGRVADMEQAVWYQKGYGSLKDYADDIKFSTTFTASKNDEVIGMARMFDGTKKTPPFLDMEFFDPELKEHILDLSQQGKIVEMGTLAKLDTAPRGTVMRGLLRMFYRQARRLDADYMACIMEPERVANINKHYGLVYEQVGPAIDYQGGDCAPHIMNIAKAEKNMRKKHPLAYYWFVKQPLVR